MQACFHSKKGSSSYFHYLFRFPKDVFKKKNQRNTSKKGRKKHRQAPEEASPPAG